MPLRRMGLKSAVHLREISRSQGEVGDSKQRVKDLNLKTRQVLEIQAVRRPAVNQAGSGLDQ